MVAKVLKTKGKTVKRKRRTKLQMQKARAADTRARNKRVKAKGVKPPKKLPPEGWLTVYEFGSRNDVGHNAIGYAIKRGRLTAITKVGVSYYIDPVKGQVQWEENVNQAARDSNKTKDKPTLQDYLRQKKDEIDAYAKIDYDLVPAHEAERRERIYKAKLAEMKVLQQASKLIEVEVVQAAWLDSTRKVRDAILNIPVRVSAELHSLSSQHKVEQRLTKELVSALDKLVEQANVC